MIRFSDELKSRFAAGAVIAVVTVETPGDAVKLADTLLSAGISGIELTLRTPTAIDCIKAIATNVPEMLLGAGTVISPEQVDAVVAAGATFAVSPGCNPVVLAAAARKSLPFAPGIATPSDIEHAVMAGANVLKFFPAETTGGLAHLNSIAAPFRHLGLRYIPLGGLRSDNFTTYLESTDCLATGGSWLAPAALIEAQDWRRIRSNCEAAKAAIRKRSHPSAT